MPTKISKVAKELNVGIKTLFEYLEKKNMPAEHNSPNVRISDEQYDLLMKAFNADHDAKRRAENQAEERKIERKGSQNEANQIKVEELTTQVKKPKILGKIDLNTGKPIGPAEAEQHAAPVQPNTSEEAAPKPVEEQAPVNTNTPAPEINTTSDMPAARR